MMVFGFKIGFFSIDIGRSNSLVLFFKNPTWTYPEKLLGTFAHFYFLEVPLDLFGFGIMII